MVRKGKTLPSTSKEVSDKLPKECLQNLKQEGVLDFEKHHLISEAAYFRAERRGFAQGEELNDWLAAETEIEELLRNLAQGAQPENP